MKELHLHLTQTKNDSVSKGEDPSQELIEFRDNFDRDSSEIFDKIEAEITKWMKNRFDTLESSSSKKTPSSTISPEPVSMSTQRSVVIPSFQQEVTREILDYASAPYKIVNLDESLPKNVHFAEQDKNINYLYMPLKRFVNRNDRTSVIRLSGQSNELDNKEIQYTAKVCFISRTDTETNATVSKSIFDFLTHIFKGEKEHILSLLQSDQTRVLAIVHKKDLNEGVLTVKSFIAVVMYTTNQLNAMMFDFIAVANNLRYKGYGPFIMHFAQAFAKVECEELSQKKLEENEPFMTYLCCRQEIKDIYENMEFQSITQTAMNKHVKKKLFANRMNLKELKKKKISLEIMSTSNIIPRVVNILNCPSEYVEQSLYEASSSSSLANTIESPNHFNRHIEYAVTSYHDGISYQKIKKIDLDAFSEAEDRTSYITSFYDNKSFFPIGKVFRKCVNEWNEFGEIVPKTYAKSLKEIIMPCMVQLICKSIINDNLDDTSCWINMKCSMCQKKVLLRKEEKQSFSNFLLKSIYSVWFTHIYGFENSDSEWYTVNNTWNVCVRRTGTYFSEVKDTLREDYDETIANKILEKAQYTSCKMLEKFIMEYQRNLLNIHESKIRLISAIQHEVEKQDTGTDISSPRKKLRRACTAHNYEERQKQMLEAIGGVVKKSSKTTTPRVGSKKDRHDAERAYNELVYMDYELQLEFHTIEYVNIAKRPSNKPLTDTSKEYLSIIKKDRQNNLKHKDKHDDNHWLMYPKKKNMKHIATPVVVAEEWFIVYNEDDIEIDRRISKQTETMCVANSNQKFKLQNESLKKIKKYVEENTKNNQIYSIEKLLKKDIPSNDVINIRYKSFRAITKIEYKGIDCENKSHYLTTDWIEVNFRASHEKFWKEVINLEPGARIDVPATSRSVDDNELTEEMKQSSPEIFFTQVEGDNSCLFSSLASAFYMLDYKIEAFNLMKIYQANISENCSVNLKMNEVLSVVKHNKFAKHNDKRFYFQVTKVRNPTYFQMLEKRNDNVIYHSVLSNLHSVVFLNQWIIDPAIPAAMPKTLENLKRCAQLDEYESAKKSIISCYTYVATSKLFKPL